MTTMMLMTLREIAEMKGNGVMVMHWLRRRSAGKQQPDGPVPDAHVQDDEPSRAPNAPTI
jgi:hypothetical protein